MLDQISQILDTAKVDDGKLILHKTPGDLGKVIADEISLFMPEAKRKKISLTAKTEAISPFLFDQIRITEALNNLISNGLKYTNEGGKVDISLKKIDGMAQIKVADDGIGIAAEKQKMLFTKFSSINQNTSAAGQKLSSGLGLYITKGIIEAHGGTISVNSEEGKGTTMTFTLPIEQAPKTS